MPQEPAKSEQKAHPASAKATGASRAALVEQGLLEHAPWLRTVVLARVQDPHAVADVMQQVSAAAMRGADRLQDPSRLAPWLYRIAVTESLMHRRRLGRGRKLLERYRQRLTRGEADTAQPDPLDWLVEAEQQQIVRRAVQSLPARDREVLLLKYTRDWSYRQIAEHLGVSQHALEGRLQRARGRLRGVLTATDPTLSEIS